ncbi:unnamed protein product [Dicrocoelium dendriticum]|nr:unnamed protein product [Dicrocoelium dendriticum]
MDLQFNAECIDRHNTYRQLHGCPPLQVDFHLARMAQAHAQKLACAQTIEAARLYSIGENVHLHIGSPSVSGRNVVDAWYSEIKSFRFREEKQRHSAHFSQLIWKSTTRAGFGRATARGRCAVFVVGLYYEKGNVPGQYTEKVPPRLDGNIPPDVERANWWQPLAIIPSEIS